MPQYVADAEGALQQGLSDLSRAALDLGARMVAVLALETAGVEIVYRWAESSGVTAAEPVACAPELIAELSAASGPVASQRPVGRFLNSTLSCSADSFLLFPWRSGRRAVSIVFGFDADAPAYAAIPDCMAGHLGLAALAAWSYKEVDHLRKELRAINSRFAGRKMIERAKARIQTERGLTEPEAYGYLRTLSRQRRVSMTQLAETLLGSSRCP